MLSCVFVEGYSEYSTGMKRRIEIARALMGNPKVLFLDEPTRGLDLPAKRETWKLLRTLASQEQVAAFLSSHDGNEIAASAMRPEFWRKAKSFIPDTPRDSVTIWIRSRSA